MNLTGIVGHDLNMAYNDIRGDPSKLDIDIPSEKKGWRKTIHLSATAEGLMIEDYLVPWEWINNCRNPEPLEDKWTTP